MQSNLRTEGMAAEDGPVSWRSVPTGQRHENNGWALAPRRLTGAACQRRAPDSSARQGFQPKSSPSAKKSETLCRMRRPHLGGRTPDVRESESVDISRAGRMTFIVGAGASV